MKRIACSLCLLAGPTRYWSKEIGILQAKYWIGLNLRQNCVNPTTLIIKVCEADHTAKRLTPTKHTTTTKRMKTIDAPHSDFRIHSGVNLRTQKFRNPQMPSFRSPRKQYTIKPNETKSPYDRKNEVPQRKHNRGEQIRCLARRKPFLRNLSAYGSLKTNFKCPHLLFPTKRSRPGPPQNKRKEIRTNPHSKSTKLRPNSIYNQPGPNPKKTDNEHGIGTPQKFQ